MLPSCFNSSSRPATAAAINIIRSEPKVKTALVIGRYGCGAYFLAEQPNAPLSGTRIALVRDLSGNGNYGTQRTALAKQPELVSVGSDYGLRFATSELRVPHAWLSGAASFQWIWSSNKTVLGGPNQSLIIADDTDFRVRWISGTTMAVYVGGVANNALIADLVQQPRLYSVRYDGAGADNSERLRVWIDGAWRSVKYNGVIPAALPAITTGLRIGEWGGAESYKGELFTLIGAQPALTDVEFAAIVGT